MRGSRRNPETCRRRDLLFVLLTGTAMLVSMLATTFASATATSNQIVRLESSVSAKNNSGDAATTSPTFSVQRPGDLVLAMISSDGPLDHMQTVHAVKDSTNSLRFHLLARANQLAGDAEVWGAVARQSIGRDQTTATVRASGYHALLTVSVIMGNSPWFPVGATSTKSRPRGAPSLRMGMTTSNSMVVGVGHDWDNAVPRTVLPGQWLIRQDLDTRTGDTSWVQCTASGATRGKTTVSFGDSNPTRDQFNLAAIEVQGATSSPPGPTTTDPSTTGPVTTPPPTTSPPTTHSPSTTTTPTTTPPTTTPPTTTPPTTTPTTTPPSPPPPPPSGSGPTGPCYYGNFSHGLPS